MIVTLRNHPDRLIVQEMHRKGSRSYWRMGFYVVIFFAVMALSLASWSAGWWPVTVACWLLQAHIGHMNLIAFHEASHFTLHPNRRLNEANGIFVGSFILTPLSVYRHVHNQHHLYLGTSRDAELWPFVLTSVPRWRRVLAAMLELFVGFFYTPVVFLHGVVTATNLPRRTARRIWIEYALCIGWWTVLLSAIGYFGVWREFFIGYMVPSLIAGNLQSLRKFTEHLGMLGDDVPSNTRTVIPAGWIGKLLSWSMMHIDFHGVHHRFSKIPQYRLPEATRYVYGPREREENVFSNYLAAMVDMFRSLGDPRVGAQWRKDLTTPRAFD